MHDVGRTPLLPNPPSPVVAALEGWGKVMLEDAEEARDDYISQRRRNLRQTKWPRQAPMQSLPLLRVGADCSGAEAPIMALRELGVRHDHCFSSESCRHVREFIILNSRPSKILYEDICKRDHSSVPEHQVYVCGFPCTPFSSLHNQTRFFEEAAANPFRETLATLPLP